MEFLKIDQIRILYQNLTEELYHLSDSLIHFTTIFYINSQKMNNIKTSEPSIPIDTCLFQNANNNNHINETMTNLSTTETSNIPTATNSNCYPCNMTNNQPLQQPYWTGSGRDFSSQPNPVRCTAGPVPTTGVFQHPKPMGCGVGSRKNDTPPPLCFPTPVVYTPEMEALFSSGGIIYARKSGK